MARQRKPEPPPLPTLFLARRPVRSPTQIPGLAGEMKYDVLARTRRKGPIVRRWHWWQADAPRKINSKYMVLDGVRYRIERVAQ